MLMDLQSTQCVVFCLPRILDVMHPGCPTNPPVLNARNLEVVPVVNYKL